MELFLKPIGIIESCFKDRFAIPRQSLIVTEARAKIIIYKQFQPELCLEGLEGFSHLWVLFGFHLNKNNRYHAKVHPPRLGGKSMGLFATRTPHRPNPIGLSVVQLSQIEKDGIVIRGADVANGTPVYDIKPYLKEIESIPHAQSGWMGETPYDELEVRYNNEELEKKVIDWEKRIGQTKISELIIQTLKQDPRPLVYRNTEGSYLESHAFRLFDGDIHFQVNGKLCTIIDIKF